MWRILYLAAVLCALLPSMLHAEPYLAVKYGYKCSQCHFNPTGGGKRNLFGTIFSQTEMPNRTVSASDIENWIQWGREADVESDDSGNSVLPDSTFYSGYLASFLSVGGDFRFNNTTVYQNATNSTSNSFDVSRGNVYASVELLDGVVAAYFDEIIAPGGAASREAFAIVRGPWDSYVKAGRMLLPFGFRLFDDTAFIRQFTGFNFGVQDVGAEVGFEPGPFSFSAAISNGSQSSSDNNNDKQYTGLASFVQRYWRVGAQATINNTPIAKRVAFGGFGGLNLGFLGDGSVGDWGDRVTLLAEIDHIIDELESLAGKPKQRQLLVYGAANIEAAKGVNLKFTYDFADPDTTTSDDSFIRLGAGVEYTITQFVQLRAFYRFQDDIETSPRDDETTLDFELHLFF